MPDTPQPHPIALRKRIEQARRVTHTTDPSWLVKLLGELASEAEAVLTFAETQSLLRAEPEAPPVNDADPTPPYLQVLHVRYPDGGCTIDLYADGQPIDAADTEDIDPGAGYDVEDWADRIAAAESLPPGPLRGAVLDALLDPPTTEGITGWDELEDHLEEARARRDRATTQEAQA